MCFRFCRRAETSTRSSFQFFRIQEFKTNFHHSRLQVRHQREQHLIFYQFRLSCRILWNEKLCLLCFCIRTRILILVDILTMFWPLYPPALIGWLFWYTMGMIVRVSKYILIIISHLKNRLRLHKFTFEFFCSFHYVQFFLYHIKLYKPTSSVCIWCVF